MVDPAGRPVLFDTSAESWLARARDAETIAWLRVYLLHYQVNVSAVTVMERVRGYSLLWRRAAPEKRDPIEAVRGVHRKPGTGLAARRSSG